MLYFSRLSFSRVLSNLAKKDNYIVHLMYKHQITTIYHRWKCQIISKSLMWNCSQCAPKNSYFTLVVTIAQIILLMKIATIANPLLVLEKISRFLQSLHSIVPKGRSQNITLSNEIIVHSENRIYMYDW